MSKREITTWDELKECDGMRCEMTHGDDVVCGEICIEGLCAHILTNDPDFDDGFSVDDLRGYDLSWCLGDSDNPLAYCDSLYIVDAAARPKKSSKPTRIVTVEYPKDGVIMSDGFVDDEDIANVIAESLRLRRVVAAYRREAKIGES
jgi:hypothetical protein